MEREAWNRPNGKRDIGLTRKRGARASEATRCEKLE